MNTSFLRRWFSHSSLPVAESLESRAEGGDAEAQFSLGFRLATGDESARDYVKAFGWYLKAAEQNHPAAQFNLGMMYAQGQGVTSDKMKSVIWLDRAAHLGDAAAQYALGVAYHRASLDCMAKNASESRIQAFKWLQLATMKEYSDSHIACGMVTLQMTREEVQEGDRRVAAFAVAQPDATPSIATPINAH